MIKGVRFILRNYGSSETMSSFIEKATNPCVNCINYRKYNYTYPHDEMYDSETKLGTCYLFGKENMVTGQVEYDDALSCRKNESKCGKNGRYYNLTNMKPPHT